MIQDLIHYRLAEYFQLEESEEKIPIKFLDNLEDFKSEFNASPYEEFVLFLALLPHLQPHYLQKTIQLYLPAGGEFPEVGGVKLNHFRGILPTLETALFFLQPLSNTERLEILAMFDKNHFFYRENLVSLDSIEEDAPSIASIIGLGENGLKRIYSNENSEVVFGSFPATKMETDKDWEDLVVCESTEKMLAMVELWIKHENKLRKEWNLDKILTQGYKVLFHGPSGTGKTLTASLLSDKFDKTFFRIDLSQISSKYVGETEKNLDYFFNNAALYGYGIFCDEADSLFSKRNHTSTAMDHFVNQQVNFLLQKIESHPGIVILSTNYKSNIDNAFLRRFDLIIPFYLPDFDERLLLWNKMLPSHLSPENPEVLQEIAYKYKLTGAQIARAITLAALYTAEANDDSISQKYLLQGIKVELEKEEKVFIPINQ